MQCCSSSNAPQQCPSYWKTLRGVKMTYFQAVCRSNDVLRGTVHEVEEDTVTDKQVDMVNISSFSFNSICSVIITKLKIGPLDLSSQQPKQAQFTWVHSWKLLLWIDLLSCYSLILVYTWIYKYVYKNMGMETFTINSCPVSDKWNFEYQRSGDL